MAKKRSTKTKAKIVDRSTEIIDEPVSAHWGEVLVRFFDENDVGMDAVWQGKDLDDFDYYYFMSGYEVYSLLPGLSETKASPGVEKPASLSQLLRSKEGLVSFAHLYSGSGSFRYALPYEGDLS